MQTDGRMPLRIRRLPSGVVHSCVINSKTTGSLQRKHPHRFSSFPIFPFLSVSVSLSSHPAHEVKQGEECRKGELQTRRMPLHSAQPATCL